MLRSATPILARLSVRFGCTTIKLRARNLGLELQNKNARRARAKALGCSQALIEFWLNIEKPGRVAAYDG